MPLVERVRGVPYGWAVPIAAITIFSFPPLFGSGKLVSKDEADIQRSS